MNLDDFDPEYEPIPIRLRKGAKAWHYYVRTPRAPFWSGSGYKKNRPGVHPNKMRDWRYLERRHHELWERKSQATNDFWSYMRAVGGQIQNDEEKWVMFNENEICRFSNDGYSMENSQSLLNDLLKSKPQWHRPYLLVKSNEGGAEGNRLWRKMNRAMECWRIYCLTFRQAVEDRLRQYLKSDPRQSKTILVRNEGRITVVTIDNGRITFPEGNVEEFA